MRPQKESLLIKCTIGAGLLLLAIEIVLVFNPFETDSHTQTASSSGPVSRLPVKGEPVEQYSHLFRGRVLDALTGKAIPAYELRVLEKEATDDMAPWIPVGPRVEISYRSGRFEVRRSVDTTRMYLLQIRCWGYGEGNSVALEALPGRITEGIEIVLDPFPPILGLVHDATSGQPVEGARVYSLTETRTQLAFGDSMTSTLDCETDASGHFALNVQFPEAHTLIISHPDYPDAVKQAVKPGASMRLRLHPGFSIRGTAFNPKGKPALKALVRITGTRDLALPLMEHHVWTDADGTFSSKKLPPGVYQVRLEAVPGFPGMSAYLGALRVFIADRDVEGIELGASPVSGSLAGRLTDRFKPIAGASVSMVRKTPALFLMSGADIPKGTELLAVTNAAGHFTLFALPPGEYELAFTLPDGRRCIPEKAHVTLEPGASLKQTFFLKADSALAAEAKTHSNDKTRKTFSFPLRGEVLAGEAPLANARVCLSMRPDAFHARFQPGEGIHTAFTDAAGYFEMNVDEPGQYTVGLYSNADLRIPLLGARSLSIPRRSPDVSLFAGFFRFEGHLIDAVSLEPVRDAEVHVINGHIFSLAVPDSSGRIVLNHLAPATTTRANTRLYVYARGYHHGKELNVEPGPPGWREAHTIFLGEYGKSLRLVFQDDGVARYSSLQHFCWVKFSDGSNVPLRQFMQEGRRDYILHGIPDMGPEIEVYYYTGGRSYQEKISVEWPDERTAEAMVIFDIPTYRDR